MPVLSFLPQRSLPGLDPGRMKDIITVGEFYDLAVGGQIIFT